MDCSPSRSLSATTELTTFGKFTLESIVGWQGTSYGYTNTTRMGEERGVYRLLAGKPEGRRPLGWPRRRWVDNIRMDLQEVGCGYMDWIGLAQDRDRWRTLVSAVMNLRVPWNAGNFLTNWKQSYLLKKDSAPWSSNFGQQVMLLRSKQLCSDSDTCLFSVQR